MKRLVFSLSCLLAFGPPTRAADALYHNIGTVNCGDAPMIDARVFINDGLFCGDVIDGALFGDNFAIPFGTQNTLSFTNNGLMQAGRGFQLDYVSEDGFHHPASSIVNNAGNPNSPNVINGSAYVLLSATNLVNRGLLEVSASGLLQLSGQNVKIARSGLLVDPAGGGGGGCVGSYQGAITPSNFVTFSGAIDDVYWGIGSVTNLATDQIARTIGARVTATSPFHAVTNLGGGFGVQVGPIANAASFVRTNTVLIGTNMNMIVQAVFIGSPSGRLDSNITAQARFVNRTYPTGIPPGNGFQTAIVEFLSQATNSVTGNPITYTLYIVDQLPGSTNYNSLTNRATGATQRPASYIVDIFPPCDWFASASPNADFVDTLLYDPNSYSNRVVTAGYAGYMAGVFSATAPVPFPVALPTNTPGRIEITADNLDMSHTRIRGESIVSIKAPHLIGSAGATVDAPNVNYNVGSTNGLLSLSGKDLANPSVQRFGGSVQMWSAVWTNFVSVVVTNIGPDTNTPPMTVTNLTTNQIEIDIHTLIVDGSGLSTVQPVLLNDFSASGTNIVLNDTVAAGGTFGINGEGLTVNGSLSLGGGWASTNVHLKSLTNNGTISVSTVMELGNATIPYKSVFNTASGSIAAEALSADVDEFRNSGAVSANNFINIKTRSGKLEGGRLSSSGDILISAQDLKMTGYQQSSVALYLDATNSLTDSGPSANNQITVSSGFNLVRKPASGDLFGTTIETQAPKFRESDHIWAAENRGATAAGYSDNAAIGHLRLNSTDTGFLFFSGGGGGDRALYVDFLELTGAARTDPRTFIGVDSDMVIYFAAANLPVESLDGLFPDAGQPAGRLRWVKDFAGPNSSQDVLLLNGQTVKMNRALRNSPTIDTDGDGVANAFDFYPLDAAAWNSVQSPGGSSGSVALVNVGSARTISLSWSSAAGTSYVVEYTTSLSAPNWQPLGQYSVTVTNGSINVLDTALPAGEAQRFYRLRFGQ